MSCSVRKPMASQIKERSGEQHAEQGIDEQNKRAK